MSELLQSLHGSANKHPGISKMLYEIRQKYYYPGIAKIVKKWVLGCEACIKDKRTTNPSLTPELLNLPEWDVGPEDALQIDLLPYLPPSGGYENIITALDVLSRYLFAYPVADASASSTAKVIIDIMTRHAYYPTTLITDKGTAFTSRLVDEVAKILGIQIKCATTKHPQTIGNLERTHASLKCNLKMASGEYWRQRHKYLPLAVFNYNTTYHSSIGCEPSRIFYGRVPYNILDHRLGLNPNPKILPTTDFAEELQRRTQILIDRTKKNIMKSYLKYKEYYDRKAKAAPLHQGDYCFILQPLADHQGSKIPFREFRWTGPYIIEKICQMKTTSPENSILTKHKSYTVLDCENILQIQIYVMSVQREIFQADDEIIIPQDDLYIISWETEYDDLPPNSKFKNASDNPSMNSDQRDAIITDLDLRSTRHDQNTDDAATKQRRDQLDELDLRSTRLQHDTNSDESEQLPEQSTENASDTDLESTGQQSNTDLEPGTTTSEGGKPDFSNPRERDIIVPDLSDRETDDSVVENESPRGGKYNLRPNPTPNFTDEYRY